MKPNRDTSAKEKEKGSGLRPRKLSRLAPPVVRPALRNLGLEQRRARLAAAQAFLRLRLAAGRAVRHLHGPRRIRLEPDDTVAVCMARNAEPWIATFLRHHLELGVRHVVILDNGSEDETVRIAASHADTTILATRLPYRRYKIPLKRWLARTFARGGWALSLDVDELLEYPFSSRLSLASFVGYLNRHGFTAVVGQMLDMFSDEPLHTIQGRTDGDLRACYPLYDISDISDSDRSHWIRSNHLSTPELRSHAGGIRRSAFGLASSMLTKHPLVRPDAPGLRLFPYSGHFHAGARLADVSAVLRHYKFTAAFARQTRAAVREGQYYAGSTIYRRYQEVLATRSDLALAGREARRYGAPEELLESGFLIASPAYLRWVRERERGAAGRRPRSRGPSTSRDARGG